MGGLVGAGALGGSRTVMNMLLTAVDNGGIVGFQSSVSPYTNIVWSGGPANNYISEINSSNDFGSVYSYTVGLGAAFPTTNWTTSNIVVDLWIDGTYIAELPCVSVAARLFLLSVGLKPFFVGGNTYRVQLALRYKT